MKKFLVLFLTVFLAISFSGCASDKNDLQKDTTQESTGNITDDSERDTDEEFIPTIGGIKRGDSKNDVIKAFGEDYEEKISEDAPYLGEPFTRMAYGNGVSVIVGNNSNKVLEIETTSSEVETNLGFKVGDNAQEVLDEYEAKYEVPVSNQDGSELTGWFLIEDQELVIFSFDKDDTLINEDVKPDSKIERIKISNFDYMD